MSPRERFVLFVTQFMGPLPLSTPDYWIALALHVSETDFQREYQDASGQITAASLDPLKAAWEFIRFCRSGIRPPWLTRETTQGAHL